VKCKVLPHIKLVWEQDLINDAFDGAQLTREIILLCSPATAPEKRLILQDDVGDQRSLCVVNDQPVGNPKRKV
jgi:hypothetical protein